MAGLYQGRYGFGFGGPTVHPGALVSRRLLPQPVTFGMFRRATCKTRYRIIRPVIIFCSNRRGPLFHVYFGALYSVFTFGLPALYSMFMCGPSIPCSLLDPLFRV